MRVEFNEVSHVYMEKTPFESAALRNVSATFPEGSFTAIIGRTGSGKSTLVQHMNGLLKPSAGRVMIGEQVVEPKTKRKQMKSLRKKVGMVFQYPEHQLFEDTVEKDLLFGPKNVGISVKQTRERLPELLQLVGLNESFLERSPFDLSGGQMRRIAIAGVLAMDPEVLILDEPTAGLDPSGQQDMLHILKEWHEEKRITVIMITHQMDEAYRTAERVIVMNEGQIAMQGTADEIYKKEKELRNLDLDLPSAVKVLKHLEKMENISFTNWALSPKEAVKQWQEQKKGKANV